MSIPPASAIVPQDISDKELASVQESTADWLWPGFVCRGSMTLLTSMWKAGKTTLLSHLLARRVSGQPLLDRVVSPGKTVVISEEPRGLWAERCRQFDFGGQLSLFLQPFPCLPSAQQWRDLLARVGELRAERGIDLLVVDSLTHFLRAESAAQGVLELMMPIRELTAKGMAALLMHHPRRKGAGSGNAGRGHGAIHSEVDISIEMRHAGNNLDSRGRQFFCLSRHADTPRHFRFELNADGADYTTLPVEDHEGFGEHWDVLRMVLEDAPQKLTRLDILEEWPEDFPKPCPATLWAWLGKAVADGLVKTEGTGLKADPFRYWVAVAEERWRANPLYDFCEQQARQLNQPFVSLREQKRRALPDRSADAPLSNAGIWPPGAPLE